MNWKLVKIATGISLWAFSFLGCFFFCGYLVCEVSPWFVPLFLVPIFILAAGFAKAGGLDE